MRITGLEGRNIRVIDVKKTEMIGERKKNGRIGKKL